MRAQAVAVKAATGRVLCATIFGPGRKKVLANGHLVSQEDALMLETLGMTNVWVADLEEGEAAEDDAVLQLAREIGCGALEIRLAAGGRANLFATEPCCLLVDSELLKLINVTATVATATLRNFSYVKTGQRVASVKSVPFAVAKPRLEEVLTIVKEKGPILQARPIRSPSLAILYTDLATGNRARQLFESIMCQRLDRLGVRPTFVLTSLEEELAVTRALQHLLRVKPDGVLIASTTSPAGPDDAVGRAMQSAGCLLERFLAPVEPGNLLLLGYKDEIPVLSAPGCFRSSKANAIDLMLPPMLARYRISASEIACLGHGGLLA